MNPVKYKELIGKKVKTLNPTEQKEVYDFVEFISLKKIKKEDAFLAALKETQTIGKNIGVTPRDIEEEIKRVRKQS